MHAIVPSHVGAGNLSSLAAPDLMAAARYHRWRTPESVFPLCRAFTHGCSTCPFGGGFKTRFRGVFRQSFAKRS